MQSQPTTNLLTAPRLAAGAILPLRLFLGGSFIAAGLDKLLGPAFLDPQARGYIGTQLAGFAPGSPLESFLLQVAVPNATLFGALVMGGELCIGIATLLGLLTRFSALMGGWLSLTFFLSATWGIQPFYFGADLPYLFGWITLGLAGPGPFALDALVRARLLVVPPTANGIAPAGALVTRRAFLGAGAAGLAGLLLAATGVGWGVLHPSRAVAVLPDTPTPVPPTTVPPTPLPLTAEPSATSEPPTTEPAATAEPSATSEPPPPAATATAEPPAPEATATAEPPAPEPTITPEPPTAIPTKAPTAVAGGGKLLAAPGALPTGQTLEFTLPGGDPAVLVHNAKGYSAYVALCTHDGCTVHPATGGLLRCPCHGAQFDPANGARVVRGPARRPLSAVAVTVEADGSVYLHE